MTIPGCRNIATLREYVAAWRAGGKLVALPIGQLQKPADGRYTLPGATKDSLNAMPSFVYNN